MTWLDRPGEDAKKKLASSLGLTEKESLGITTDRSVGQDAGRVADFDAFGFAMGHTAETVKTIGELIGTVRELCWIQD